MLRNEPPLLDTRIRGPLMFVSRLFLSLCVAISAAHLIRAESATATQSGDRDKPATPAGSEITFSSVHVDGSYIAMTFDDGPSAKLTPKLLDLLAAHHIRATFFVIGENVAEHPEIVERAAREGHEIGNHTWAHPKLGKMSDDAVRRDLKRADDAIKRAIGTRPTLLRPPYGSISSRQKNWIHEEFGYRIILWDVDPLDWKRPGPMTVCNRIVKEARPGSIVLSHDIHPGTIEAMPATLDQLEAKGFRFVTVSELIRMAKPETPKPASTPRPDVPPASPPSTSTITSPSSSPRG